MSKAFTLNSIFPSITSVTKTEASAKRATGRIVPTRAMQQSRATATPRMRAFSAKWVGSASAAGLAMVVVALGFYVYTINVSASKGYDFKKQQAVVDELNETQKRLVIQQASMGSIVKVNDVASTAGMIPVTGEEFLVASQISKR